MSEHISRRNLPHWYMPGAAHFVTYRLAGTIPIEILRGWRDERERLLRAERELPPSEQLRLHKHFFARYDRYLDERCERPWLHKPEIAEIVRDNLYHHHGSRYELLAYCVMPNHVHILVQPLEKEARCVKEVASSPTGNMILSDEFNDARSPLASIMHSLKSYTANIVNARLGRRGQLWQHESYDHWVRDMEELERIINYIRLNPVRAGLCSKPHDWPFSSARDRFDRDRDESGLIGRLREDWH